MRWQDCAVVRDADGVLWVKDPHSDERFVGDGEKRTADLDADYGPITPVLDAEGHLIVTTVGDLTAGHIGGLVRAETEGGEVREGRLRGIAPSPGFGVQLAIGGGHCPARLDAPCEVIA